jgi:biotin operon repressor
MAFPRDTRPGWGARLCLDQWTAAPHISLAVTIKHLLILAAVLAAGPIAYAAEDLRSEVVQQLRSVGSDVRRSHRFDFYLYVTNEADAKAASARLREKGLQVEVRRGVRPGTWLCFAQATMVPDSSRLTELGALFYSLARVYKGDFDGWEAEVVK